MSERTGCRLCGRGPLVVRVNLPNSPGNVSRMLRPDEKGLIPAFTAEVLECERCGFIGISSELESTFYDDYLATFAHSPKMVSFQRRQAREFVSRFALEGRKIIEIGCGDGHYMGELANAGAIVVGLEPSAIQRKLAIGRGFQVYSGYVRDGSPAPNGPYEAFAAREVLEHVPDPHDFLGGIAQSLSPGAVGLVEVPNLDKTLAENRFYDFFADHVNYFTERTLRLALEMNGFDIEDIVLGMDDEYRYAYVRYCPCVGLDRLQESVNETVRDMRGFIEKEAADGRRVAIWGAGGKGVASLSIAGITDVSYIIDSDPHKHGRLTPVTHIPIYAPSKLRSEPVDTVLITAMAFADEILAQLRGELGFNGKVALISPRLHVLENEH